MWGKEHTREKRMTHASEEKDRKGKQREREGFGMCVPGWKRASGPGVVGGLRLWRWSPPVPSHWGGVRGRGTGIAGVSHFLFPFSPASPGGQCQLRLAPCICSFSVRGLSVVLSCCSTVCACYRTGSRSSHPRSAVSLSLSLSSYNEYCYAL